MELPAYIGRYILRREIARGGFAVVALSWDEELEAEVAIKIYLDSKRENDLLKQRFIEEARLLRRIQSYNLVGVHDIGRLSDGSPYFVMDYADLGTLTHQIKRQAVNAENAHGRLLSLVDAMTSGLSAIHRAGVVHRDIKPDNILYQSVGGAVGRNQSAGAGNDTLLTPTPAPQNTGIERVMIGDLGIASDLFKGSQTSPVLGGTPAFMAPEQFDVEGGSNPTADIFSATAVLWYTVTGRLPKEFVSLEKEITDEQEPWRDFFLRGMAHDPRQRFADIESWSSAAHDVMARIAAELPEPTGVEFTTTPQLPEIDCPYRGLSAFRAEDADRFFGREELIADVLQRFRTKKVMVVGGASGSGKSSLVRAGVIPALQQGRISGSANWRIELFTPGRDAMSELFFRLRGEQENPRVQFDEFISRPTAARHILQGPRDEAVLLVIDQFEEIFTLNDRKAAQGFIDALAAVSDPADSSVRIILTVRADFYEKCAAFPWLAQAVNQCQVLVGPMTSNDLRRAIVEPARWAGVYVEQHLVDAIISEAGNDAGVLPLISHALVETWSRRLGATLTYEGYRISGGMAGAIRQTADEIFDQDFSDAERKVAERLLLSLVTPGDGGADTRRILARSDLQGDPDADLMERVIKRLTEARLLTVDDETVQITHEALLRSWPRLGGWIEQYRGDLRLRLRVVQMADEWIEAGRDDDMLLSGARLGYVMEWFEKNATMAGVKEREFLTASLDRQDAIRKDAKMRREKRRRRQILAVSMLAVLAVGATGASIIAFIQSEQAQANAALADAATEMANDRLANALGAAAAGYARDDPLLALNLAAQSIVQSRSPRTTYDARVALLRARQTLAEGIPVPVGEPVAAGDARSITISPDAASVVTGSRDGLVRILDGKTRLQVGEDIEGGIGGIQDIAFSPDGDGFAAVGDSGRIAHWPYSGDFAGTRTLIGETEEVQWGIGFHPEEKVIATAGQDGKISIWPLGKEAPPGSGVFAERAGNFTSVSFDPDGKVIAAGNGSGEVRVWQYPSGAYLFPPIDTVHSSDVWQVSFSHDGALLATASSDGNSALIDAVTGEVRGKAFPAEDIISAVEFAPGLAELVGGNMAGELLVWDVSTEKLAARSPVGHSGHILDVALASGREVAVTLGADQNVRFWRLGPTPRMSRSIAMTEGARPRGLALTENGLYVGDTNGTLLYSAFDASETTTGPSFPHQVWALALSGDASVLAAGDRSGQIIISDAGLDGLGSALASLGEAVWSLAFSEGGDRLFAAAESGAHMIDVQTGETLRRFEPAVGSITDVAVHDEVGLLAVSTSHGDVLVWATEQDTPPLTLQVSGNRVWSVAFNKDGALLAAADSNEVVSVWSIPQGTREMSFTGHVRGATDVLFLADDTTLVASDRRGGLHFWDIGLGKRLGRIPAAHDKAIWRIAAHPDGQTFASSGDDGYVSVWDIFSVQAACRLSSNVLGMVRREQYLGDARIDDACRTLATP